MKSILVTLMLAVLIIPAEAKKRPAAAAAQKERARREDKQQEKERQERERKRTAVAEFLNKKDKNNDGSLSLDEYLADETNKEAARKKFDQFNKNRDRSLARSEVEALLGL